MKKLLAIAAMSALASLGTQTAQAGTWDVLCIKQGPKRGFAHLPVRTLNPLSNVAPAPQSGYPDASRSIPTRAKVAEMSDIVGDMNFISLGFGGSIVLSYSEQFANVPGNDITVYETTWGNPRCTPNVSESALVEFSQDGVNWIQRNACHNGSYDISPLLWARFVRITDKTNNSPSIGGDGVDAYDVDGVVAVSVYNGEDPPSCDYQQGVASQFVGAAGNFPGRGIVAQRKNFANANINEFSGVVIPSTREVSGWYNFWSIGFGGRACFQLPYSVFAAPGADFKLYETTWNNKPCPNYPETVKISVSPDNINWGPARFLCKDGDVDFGTDFPVVNYIKFEDITDPTKFGGGADAFDIDNIFIYQPPYNFLTPPNFCESPQGGRRSVPAVENILSEGGVPEEMFPLDIVGSNVVSDKIAFTATIAEQGGYTYSIRNHTGQEVLNGAFEGGLYENPTVEVSTGKFASGVYFLTLSSATGKETVKFIKK